MVRAAAWVLSVLLALALIVFFSWVMAGAVEVTESNGVHYFPDGCRFGAQLLDQINSLPDYARDGTRGYCFDCIAGTAPAQQGTGCGTFPNFPTGACGCNWFRQQGVVICIGAGHCVPFVCPVGEVQVGVDSNCGPVCELACLPGHALNPIGGVCVVDTDCCFGFCVDGICSVTMTTSTSTTTAPGPTTTTTAAPTTTTTAGPTTTTTAPSTTTTVATTTTTSSTTTSTSTTTTSTTTTTTLLASVTFEWVPGPGESGGSGILAADGTLFCNLWVAPIGLLNATTFVFVADTGGPAGNVGVAVYNADGSSRISSTGGIALAGGSVITTTTGAFTLVAGTAYEVCFCSNKTSGAVTWTVARDLVGNALTNVQRAFTTPLTTTATNACVTGSPPLTTGSLVAHSHAPLMLLLATDSP